MEEVCRCKDTTQKKNGSKKRRKSKPRSGRSGDTNGWLAEVCEGKTDVFTVCLSGAARTKGNLQDRQSKRPAENGQAWLSVSAGLGSSASGPEGLGQWRRRGKRGREWRRGVGAATGLDLGVGRCQGKLARENWKVWSGRRSERERRERETGSGRKKIKANLTYR